MKTEIAGITRANEGMQGISWNILGQTYVPKNCTEHSFSWHATFPPGTFVPPHIHPDQDEYLYILEGKLDFMLAGADAQATPGDLVRLRHGHAARHLQQIRSDRESAVLGVADPKTVRPVLGPPQHEGAEARMTWWRSPPNTTSTSCRRRRAREATPRSSSRAGAKQSAPAIAAAMNRFASWASHHVAMAHFATPPDASQYDGLRDYARTAASPGDAAKPALVA